MSKRETPMIRKFWQTVGGTLVEEFPVVKASATCGPRRVDGVILLHRAFERARPKDVSLEGEEIIVIQAKAARLSMSLLGQTLFSAELVKRFQPASVRAVALCTKDDSELRQLLRPFPHVQIVVCSEEEV
jgi:hypothetical protein